MIINLYLYSWAGVSPGATHWYAEIQSPHATVKLTDTLTAAQAIALNRKQDRMLPPRPYKAGDAYEGFDTVEAAVRAGVEQWLRLATVGSAGKFPVQGDQWRDHPKPLLATSFLDVAAEAELKARIRGIVDRCEAVGWWDDPANGDLMDRLYREWQDCLASA